MRIIKYFFFVFLMFFLFACSNKKKQTLMDPQIPLDPRMDLSMERTHNDSTQIIAMSEGLLDLLKAKKIDEAIGKLTFFDENLNEIINDTILKEQKENRRAIFKTFPVYSYKVDYFSLFSDVDTEVGYTIEMFPEDKNNLAPNTMKFVLKFRRINGEWEMGY